MTEMTSHERFKRMFEHREADRAPIVDSPWATTIERWQGEGLPEDVNWVDYFDVDHMATVGPDYSPRFERRVIEETDEYTIQTNNYGAIVKKYKHLRRPEVLDHTITGPDVWRENKHRCEPTPDRIKWDYLAQNYKRWREKGYWLRGAMWFGFDISHSRWIGTERFLMAMVTDPEWCVEMFEAQLDMSLALLDMAWDKGYTFDEAHWYDDMGYKGHQFFSVNTYREMLKPVHKRAIEWAHAKGVKAHLHSCGDIRPLIPELIDIGLDALNPIEVKAGMDPVELKRKYGKDLVFKGGINAALWDKPEKISAEMKKTVPVMKESGGYIFSSDHSVPHDVSLEDFRGIIELAKELGKYS